MVEHQDPNRLIHEASPYLQQHAHNPVDWYPWGDEALARARTEDKPIFLSVGYSACHWCHVMEHESFVDPDIAAIMNQHFVNIKVDREERPDLDQVYQTICQLITHQGGWPLSVWLTPEQKPFYVGTYFPPASRYGRPGFPQLLLGIQEAWENQREEVLKVAEQWTAALAETDRTPLDAARAPAETLLDQAAAQIEARFDRQNGGFGQAPKFPNPDALQFLLRCHDRTGEPRYLEMATQAGLAMAQGGICDHLGGGFHRYSVDARWSVPHFEKMLYDNALLPPVYLNLYRLTGDPLFAQIVRETLAYVEREMTDPEGGFYSTQDADSEGEEGKFFVWTPAGVRSLLGPEDGDLVCRHFGITERGNFEDGTTVLSIAASPGELAAAYGTDEQGMRGRLSELRRRLWAAREQRVKPGRDDKILTAWNGLMISAFAQAARVLGDDHYVAVARRAATFASNRLSSGTDRLWRRYKDGKSGIAGYLEDYAYFTAGLIDLYAATFDEQYLVQATAYARVMLDQFRDADGAGFFLTPVGGEPLILRPRDVYDSALPAAQSVALACLLRLYPFTGDGRFPAAAEAAFPAYAAMMERAPFGTTSLLAAYDLYRRGGQEVTIVAAPGDATAADWARRVHGRFMPNLILTRIAPNRRPDATTRALTGGDCLPPIWAGKEARNGQAALYVCRQFTCSPPASTWAEAEQHLAAQ